MYVHNTHFGVCDCIHYIFDTFFLCPPVHFLITYPKFINIFFIHVLRFSTALNLVCVRQLYCSLRHCVTVLHNLTIVPSSDKTDTYLPKVHSVRTNIESTQTLDWHTPDNEQCTTGAHCFDFCGEVNSLSLLGGGWGREVLPDTSASVIHPRASGPRLPVHRNGIGVGLAVDIAQCSKRHKVELHTIVRLASSLAAPAPHCTMAISIMRPTWGRGYS